MTFKSKTKTLFRLTFLGVGLILSQMLMAQQIASKRMSIQKKNAKLETVLNEIKAKAGYKVFYNSTLVDNLYASVEMNNATVDEILKKALDSNKLTYTLEDNTIVISKKREKQEPEKEVERTIQGTVTDDLNMPLIGATIRAVECNFGTATDQDGSFELKIPAGSKEIEVSFIGMKKKKVNLNKKAKLRIILEEDKQELSDVIVTGYQTLSKERSTGSFVKISGDKLQQKRLNSLSTLLKGQVAGYSNGLIRGTSTMEGVASPLYVIDGFPVENTNYDSENYGLKENLPSLNMEDIESITILKDAAAASIYGARAANGVIVITTKKATKGKTSVSFSTSLTVTPYSYYKKNLTNSADIISLEKEWAANNPNLHQDGAAEYALSLRGNAIYDTPGTSLLLDFYSGKLSQTDLDQKLNQLSSQGYSYYNDLEKYAKRNPFYQQYNLTIGKGTETNSFNASLSYRNNKREDKYTDDQSIGLNMTNSAQITKWLTLDLGTYINYQAGNTQSFDPLSPGYTFMPYSRLVNSDGTNYTNTAAERLSVETQNNIKQYNLYSMDITPLDEIKMNINHNKTFTSRSYIKLNVDFFDWLSYNTMFQYEFGSGRDNKLYDKNSHYVRSTINNFTTYDPTNGVVKHIPYGYINFASDQYSNLYNFRQQLNFDKQIAEKHHLSIIAGSEIRNMKLELTNQRKYNYDPDMLTYTSLSAENLSYVPGITGDGYLNNIDLSYQNEIVNRFVSVYSNAGYIYNDKYTLTGSIRLDRSNLWGTNSSWQNKPIWSSGVSWNINKESFFKLNWVDMLKLRLSYGIGGNISKNSAPYMTAAYLPNYNYGGISGQILRYANPNLSWEKTITTNLGVDFSVLQGKISGSIDIYNKQGKNLLVASAGVPTEGFTGSSDAVFRSINNGEMSNKGIELSLAAEILKTNDFSWDATFIYGYNKNRVKHVNETAPDYQSQISYPEDYPQKGRPYEAIYGYKWAGLNENGLPQVYNANGDKTTSRPTDLKSIAYLGSRVPTYSGSLNNTFNYKNFEFSFLITYEGGHKMKNVFFLPILPSKYPQAASSEIIYVAPTNKDINKRWKKKGDEAYTNVPRVIFAEDPDFNIDSPFIYKNSSAAILDASNIQINNISLAYQIPAKLTQRVLLGNAKLRFNIENLHMFSKDQTAKHIMGGFNAPNYVFELYVTF